MPHGSIRLGDVEATVLCDAVVRFPRPLAEALPDVPASEWQELRRRYPETLEGEEGFRFHIHCTLIRSPDRTILVDTGNGPPSTLAARWFGAPGLMPQELAEVGVAVEDIDVVVITHLHLDHISWALQGPNVAVPVFPNARYLISRTEWEGFRELGDDDDKAAFDQQALPLSSAGVLDLLEGDRVLTQGVTVVATPGHTPGHQSVLVRGGGRRVLIAGDLTAHPAQVTEPAWRSGGDLDPPLAAWTRRRWLDRVESEGMVLSASHYPYPFGVLGREDGRRYFLPAEHPRAASDQG